MFRKKSKLHGKDYTVNGQKSKTAQKATKINRTAHKLFGKSFVYNWMAVFDRIKFKPPISLTAATATLAVFFNSKCNASNWECCDKFTRLILYIYKTKHITKPKRNQTIYECSIFKEYNCKTHRKILQAAPEKNAVFS